MDKSKRHFRSAMQELKHMIVRNPLVLLAVGGIAGAIVFSFVFGRTTVKPHNEMALPPSSPYTHNVAGTGIVEANSKNIQVGSYLSGIVESVFVKEGDVVKKGDPLFTLDTRTAKADVDLKTSDFEVAQSSVDVAKAELDQAQDQYNRVQGIKSGMAISVEDKANRGFALQKAKAAFIRSQHAYEGAKNDLNLARITLEKSTVRAPIDGLIMKVYTKPGEFVNTQSQSQSSGVVLMGNNNPLYVRVQIDENDVWRFQSKTPAVAFLKSNKDMKYPLKCVRIEPYALPKSQLSGDLTERVDTRILEVVYEITVPTPNLYIGQLLDVFIQVGS